MPDTKNEKIVCNHFLTLSCNSTQNMGIRNCESYEKILLVKYKNLKIDQIDGLKKGIYDLFPKDLLS